MPRNTFNPSLGTVLRDEGMNRARQGVNPEWYSFMEAALVEVAKRKPFFYTDDIELIRQTRQGPSTPEPRAMGPLMMRAKRDKICEPIDRWVRSSQSVNHRRPMRVWKSLLYQQAPPGRAPASLSRISDRP